MKFIVVTGGVISGLGKGITASSIGLILQNRGLNVTAIKIDPYLNVDAGTMSPYEHGETYVLSDGGEADLDLGNYERFLNIELTSEHNLTTGKVYQRVIKKERRGDYLGKTVQIVPHVTDEIQRWIVNVADGSDICMIEVGGTIGDMEIAPFIEALRQLSHTEQICFVHVSMMVDNGELKTKPTQHSITQLRSLGIQPNLLVIRTPIMLPDSIRSKLSRFCHIPESHIISNTNVQNLYFVPKLFDDQNVPHIITQVLRMPSVQKNHKTYQPVLQYFQQEHDILKLGMVGKYVGSQDTYLSLIRAIEHAAIHLNVKVELVWMDSEQNMDFTSIDGLLIPGGFGTRGIQGKRDAVSYSLQHNVPILGICLGFQVMMIEYAEQHDFKSVHGRPPESQEWNSDNYDALVHILPYQSKILGGTMRLGNYETILKPGSLVHELYQTNTIVERHRHRYEANQMYVPWLEQKGMHFPGVSVKIGQKWMETLEIPSHSFFVGCQYHPEFRSRVQQPHPLFLGLIRSMMEQNY